ncbi:hypothetical protein MTO96_035051 [Rhipicephalus appendiculatus]
MRPAIRPFHNLMLGQVCRYTSQCAYGLCCLLTGSPPPTCQSLSSRNHLCSNIAVGGVYRGHCPCREHLRCVGRACMLPPGIP